MDGLSAGKRCAVGTYPQRIHLNNVIIDSAFCVIQKLVVSLTGENRMKKLILTIVLCAFAMVVAGLNIRSMQNRGVKEATVEAEVEDIVGMNKGSRGEISWNVIYKYSYKGKEYELSLIHIYAFDDVPFGGKRKDEKMTIFCERAKTRMKELHITTRQLAKSIGMTESTVSRYLSGNRSPKIEELVKIAETLECSADYLLGLKESEVVVQKEIFKEIAGLFNKLSNDSTYRRKKDAEC